MAFLAKQDQLGKHEYLPENLGILTVRGRIEVFNYAHAQLGKNKAAMAIYDEANSFQYRKMKRKQKLKSLRLCDKQTERENHLLTTGLDIKPDNFPAPFSKIIKVQNIYREDYVSQVVH